jgi:acetyl-CoA synthetase (ADP-forming)
MTAKPGISIAHVIGPRSIAIIGASEDIMKFGGRITHNLIRHGYAGKLLLINPNRQTLFDRPAYPSISAAPGPIDLALISVPVSQLLRTVEDCGKAGVGACIIVTAQLAEFDQAGAKLQDEVVAVARTYGMRLVGPNCMGMISPVHALGLTSSMTLQYAETLRPGPVGLVSQSGALMGTLFVIGHDLGLGFSSMISVGNQADLDICDFLEGQIDDDVTTTICLYIEAIKDPQRFFALAARARAKGKRILTVKAGRTEAGSAMARSHTASLAGSFAAFEAACRKAGVLVMDEPEGMIAAAGVMARNPRMGAGGFGMIVSSGGGGAVTADRMSQSGLPLAPWSEATHKRLAEHYLAAHRNNPVDLGAHIGALGPHIFKHAIEAAYEDEGVGAFVYLMTPQPLMDHTADALIDVWRRGDKPVIVILDTSRFADDVRARFIAAGMPFVTRIDDGLRVLDAYMRERTLSGTATVAPERPAGAGPLPESLAQGYLTEPEAKALLRAYGIATTGDWPALSADEAVAAARAIGYPVVMKGVSRDIVHKSDAGLVKLALRDETGVRDAFAGVAAALSKLAPGEKPAVTVQPMIAGDAELIVGVRGDPSFGPQVLVGFGGVLVEVLRDVQSAGAPVSAHEAEAMLRRLTMWPVLGGTRGRPALDVAAVVDVIVRMSYLAADLGPRLVDLEVNPLIVRAAGGGAVAVDGRGTIGE